MDLRTRWADDVDPDDPLPEYPRPQLRRSRWTNLNGRWDLAVTHKDDRAPTAYPEQIVVPFPAGSALSGIDRVIGPDDRLWMRRTFSAPDLADGERLRLHFGAVDWECEVWCNEQWVGAHQGGFDPFHLDLTSSVRAGAEQELIVAVSDPTDTGTQPLGKQTLNPFAIQYTAVAGIWQTVWLEPVPSACIECIAATTSISDQRVTVQVSVDGSRPGDRVAAAASSDGSDAALGDAAVVAGVATVELDIADLRLWSPDDPHLYDLHVELRRGDEITDDVTGYFGARETAVARDPQGIWRLTLNGAPIFHLGLLDQGWWPDGLYTAPTDEALAFDIEISKAMGFNTIRKHVKVEPARWYWHADRLGVLVWQDMPSTRFDMIEFGRQMSEGVAPADMDWAAVSPGRNPAVFRRELDAMIDALSPFPSIVVWVPFNESWGQHDTDATLAHVARRDPSRLVDGPSGWVDTGTGHIRDHHVYQQEAELPPLDDARPLVYGEYGGPKLAVEGHVARDDGWGYADTSTPEELAEAYEELTAIIAGLVDRGLAGALYTQMTDVESELNGLLTYDREIKIPPDRIAEMHRDIT